MFCWIDLLNYRIAGKFRGRKFSRLTSLKTFCELNFEDQLDYHCICSYTIIRFSRINFHGSCEIHENREIYCPRKIPAIRYAQNLPKMYSGIPKICSSLSLLCLHHASQAMNVLLEYLMLALIYLILSVHFNSYCYIMLPILILLMITTYT